MLLSDLKDKVTYGHFLETLKGKLNGTFVQYNDYWWWCDIDIGIPHNYPPDKYGQGEGWITLGRERELGGNTHEELNTIEHIETEPEWPDSGFYWMKERGYEFFYTKQKCYKAGLSPNIFKFKKLGRAESLQLHHHTTARMLQYVTRAEYPALDVAIKLIRNKKLYPIPLTKQLLLGVHPYIDSPVIYYKDRAIAKITPSGKIALSTKHPQFIEYLKNIGEIYAPHGSATY